ncbi:MAG: hypothetical protein HGB15_01880 [Chlorobaculum sp.]|nr:hypothetical protein [Chlorobaculum sp.]
MPEQHERSYSTLFELRLLHHYWLDEGDTVFDRLNDEQQERYLLTYDAGAFLEIVPTEQTEHALKACRAIWRKTRTGIIVSASGEALIPAETVLEWRIEVIDPNFFSYTALTLQPQPIRECYTEDKSTRYRFRENTPLFTNLTGASRGSGESKTLFLSREIGPLDPEDKVEALFESGGALCQLTADQGGETPAYQTLDADKAAMPLFANQRDVPDISPPEGVTDAPAKGILLDDEVTGNFFALLRIAAWSEDDGDFSFIESGGELKASAPVYHLRLKSRSTWWKWIDHKGAENLSETPLPLTFYGNASSPKSVKPSVGAFKAEMSDEKAVSRLVSEIFI